MIPRATYRLQFHKDFTFTDAAGLADYFAALGISHIYASPILTARAGSQHGYDVVDPSRINPELGGEDGFRAMAAAFKTHSLGLILDIVPNHLAVGQADNRLWLDLLENGRASPSAEWFDVDWEAPGLENKILAPFLEDEPQALWEKGELALVHDDHLRKWAFAYFGHRFPLRPEDQKPHAVQNWSTVESLLAGQHFVLANWHEADCRINWRRFFDINELAGIRTENPTVFEAIHAITLELYGEGLIDGVRIDHIDGLADPAAYCQRLHNRLSALRPDPYLVVEKILAGEEQLPADWPVHGTTGYDAMNNIAALLHADVGGELETLWRDASRRAMTFEDEEITARQEMLDSKFSGQSDAVIRAFAKAGAPLSKEELRRAIISLRCYRGYATGKSGSPNPSPLLSKVLNQAPTLRHLFDDDSGDPLLCDALRRFHQLSAPIAAKAVEDTAFYRYGKLLSRNDVGFDPRCTFLSPENFHRRALRLAQAFPHTMLTTATHDHKRGEDARARLAVLSARPDLWAAWLREAPTDDSIDQTDSYMLYQTLIGAWTGESDEDFAGRIEGWCRKYLREAKLRSTWQNPNTSYEDRFCAFTRGLILDGKHADFRQRLNAFLSAIRPLAETNILVQAVLRNTLPGVPDLYQGSEFLDFSLVDPDNRRPVNYAGRKKSLSAPVTNVSPLDHRKQRAIANLLLARRDSPDLWHLGDYQPQPAGDGLIAFSRTHLHQAMYVVARCNSSELSAKTLQIMRAGKELLSGRWIPAGSIAACEFLAEWPAAAIFCDAQS
jgi:(1->4)-alpha-D-glucan 1-alpha-D-glucosylmutase